jgi:hypothetical protein
MENSKVLLVATIFSLFIIGVVTTTSVYAESYYSDSQKYDHGYYKAMLDCESPQTQIDFMSTPAYEGHSEQYHQGYLKAVSYCQSVEQQKHDYYIQQHPVVTTVSHQNFDSTSNQITSQGQVNKPIIICVTAIGNCDTRNGQTQYSSNPNVFDPTAASTANSNENNGVDGGGGYSHNNNNDEGN